MEKQQYFTESELRSQAERALGGDSKPHEDEIERSIRAYKAFQEHGSKVTLNFHVNQTGFCPELIIGK